MELAQATPSVSRRNVLISFGGGAHTRKFFRRHDQKKLMIRFRKKDEFLGGTATPACGNGDSIFFVNGMTKLAGVEALIWRIHWRVEECSILTHFSPLLTTLRANRQ